MKKALRFIWRNRTKALGFIQITLGTLASADGIFSPFALKCIILASGLATAYVGFFNSAQLKNAAPQP